MRLILYYKWLWCDKCKDWQWHEFCLSFRGLDEDCHVEVCTFCGKEVKR